MSGNSLAQELESHASSRANFYEASDEDRQRIARMLRTARSQAKPVDSHSWEDNDYVSSMEWKKCRCFHACGVAGISTKEASIIWWNVVYDGLEPAKRGHVV